jgi:hypothetical protein
MEHTAVNDAELVEQLRSNQDWLEAAHLRVAPLVRAAADRIESLSADVRWRTQVCDETVAALTSDRETLRALLWRRVAAAERMSVRPSDLLGLTPDELNELRTSTGHNESSFRVRLDANDAAWTAALDERDAVIAELQADNDRLRAALEPLAGYAEGFMSVTNPPDSAWVYIYKAKDALRLAALREQLRTQETPDGSE